MKEIIFGTTNPAKIIQAQAALDLLGIKVRGLAGFENLPKVVEDGETAQENARKKALVYCKAIGQVVLSMDNALYIDGLNEEEQPGIHTGRIPGFVERPDDEQLIKYYSALFEKHGGELSGHWEFALCLAWPEGRIKEITAIPPKRIFTSHVCSKRLAGYPLESMQIDPETNKYIAEMTKEEQDKFWLGSVGKELQELFKDFCE
ncbi:MAG: non-canonical purine NTP pyrophosphatase [Patescibacteria group bacterium]